MIRTIRNNYAAITATLALLAALGSGVAVAGGLIGSKDIRDRAVRARHVGFALGTVGKFSGKDVLSTGGSQILMRDSFKIDDAGTIAPTGAVVAENVTVDPGTVGLQVVVNGKIVGGTYGHVVRPGEVQTITVPLLPPKIIRPGKHAYQLRAFGGKGDILFKSSQLAGAISPSMIVTPSM